MVKNGKKRCSKCKVRRVREEFPKRAVGSNDGLQSSCKPCNRLYQQSRHIEIPVGLVEKTCSKCKTLKSIDCFYVSPKNSDGLSGKCRDCIQAYGKEKITPAFTRIRTLKSWGFTPETFDALLASQNYGCLLCESKDSKVKGRAFSVDHNHSCCPGKKSCGKCIRGLLCGHCNTGIGLLKDDEQILHRAAVYLKYQDSRPAPINPDPHSLLIKGGRGEIGVRITELKGYGLTLAGFDALLKSQNHKCAICDTDKPTGPGKKFHVDHNHITGKVRGLLCHGCNTGIGLLQDSEELLHKAAVYVKYRGI